MSTPIPQPTDRTDHRPEIAAFAKAVLPPLIGRYAVKFLRIAAMTPFGRAVGLIVAIFLVGALIIPALFVALAVWLISQDPAAAGTAGLITMAIAAIAIMMLLSNMWRRWKQFRRKHLY